MVLRGLRRDAFSLLLDSWIMAILSLLKEPECNELARPLQYVREHLDQPAGKRASATPAPQKAHPALVEHIVRGDVHSARNILFQLPSDRFPRDRLAADVLLPAMGEIGRLWELDALTLRSPIQGHLYKFDLRVGEQLLPQDYRRVVIGRPEKQVRLFVEVFWLDRVRIGDLFLVQDADTGGAAGSGRVAAVSEYVGARDFRTEDTLERLDTKYAQAVLHLEGTSNLPLGKLVICVRNGGNTQDEPGKNDGR